MHTRSLLGDALGTTLGRRGDRKVLQREELTAVHAQGWPPQWGTLEMGWPLQNCSVTSKQGCWPLYPSHQLVTGCGASRQQFLAANIPGSWGEQGLGPSVDLHVTSPTTLLWMRAFCCTRVLLCVSNSDHCPAEWRPESWHLVQAP